MSSDSSKKKESSAAAGVACGASGAEIRGSARAPMLLLFATAILWLVFASGMAFLASLKFHAPALLAHCPIFTYGRLVAVFQSSLVYGFAAQAAMALLAWLIVHGCRVRLVQPGLVVLAILFWNVGVKFGVLALFMGQGTGHAWLEMPGFASVVMFSAWTVFAVCALLSFHRREDKSFNISHWYVIIGLLWFPWILAAAGLSMASGALRGVMPALLSWWYANNLLYIWLGFTGLAGIFHCLPRFTGRPVHSHSQAAFAFWVLLLCGTIGGIHHGAPVSLGIPSFSTIGNLLVSVALIALVTIFGVCLRGKMRAMIIDPVFRFVGFGAAAFFILWICRIVGSIYPASEVTQFTFFNEAVNRLAVSGFLAMVFFGVFYHAVPDLCGFEWPMPKLIQVHFWTAGLGILLYAGSMAFGGVVQGLALLDPAVTFNETTRSTFFFLRVSTSGELLMLGASVVLALHFFVAFCQFCMACWKQGCRAETQPESADLTA